MFFKLEFIILILIGAIGTSYLAIIAFNDSPSINPFAKENAKPVLIATLIITTLAIIYCLIIYLTFDTENGFRVKHSQNQYQNQY